MGHLFYNTGNSLKGLNLPEWIYHASLPTKGVLQWTSQDSGVNYHETPGKLPLHPWHPHGKCTQASMRWAGRSLHGEGLCGPEGASTGPARLLENHNVYGCMINSKVKFVVVGKSSNTALEATKFSVFWKLHNFYMVVTWNP